MKKAYLYILPLWFVLQACQKEIEYDLPQSEPKYILNSYVFSEREIIIRDTILIVPTSELYVGQSSSIFDDAGPLLTNDGELRFYENNIALEGVVTPIGLVQPISFVQHNYIIRHAFEPGKLYRIEAENEELGLASAEFLMPDSIPLLSVTHDTITQKVTFTFKDPPGSDYYYFRIEAREGNSFSPFVPFSKTDPIISFFDKSPFDSVLAPSITSSGNVGWAGFINDQTFDGQLKTMEVAVYQNFRNYPDIYVVLNHITYDMYEHERTLAAYTSTKDNPFAEKVQIYTNISNGFGVFGGATSSRLQSIKK